MRERELVIIGAGAAGMAAALGAYDNGIRDILLIEKEAEAGGILNQCIHNGFGLHTFKEELSGPGYAERYYTKIEDKGIDFLFNTQVIRIGEDKTVEYVNENGYDRIRAKAIVLSTGSKERTGASINLLGDRAVGVYTAGAAQKYLNMHGILVGKRVFILGSGDIGLIMARRMTLEGAKVLGVAEIMPYSNGLARNIKQCLEDFDIPLYLSHTIIRVNGRPHLKSVTMSKVDENLKVIKGTEQEIECDVLLLSIGLRSDISLLDDIDIKKKRGAIVDNHYMTSKEGIFVAGNALHIHDLVDYVSQEAYDAGKYAAMYIKDHAIALNKHHALAGNGLGYVIPETFGDEDVTFSFRVNRVFKQCVIRITGDGLNKEIRKLSLIPSEMERITLKKEILKDLKGDLRIEVSEWK